MSLREISESQFLDTFLLAGATGQPLQPPPHPLQLLSLAVFLNDLSDCTALYAIIDMATRTTIQVIISCISENLKKLKLNKKQG